MDMQGRNWIWKDKLQDKSVDKCWISMDMKWISFHIQERYPFISKMVSFDILLRYPWDIWMCVYLRISQDILGYPRISFWGKLPDECTSTYLLFLLSPALQDLEECCVIQTCWCQSARCPVTTCRSEYWPSDVSNMPWGCLQFCVAAVSQKLLPYDIIVF